MFAPCPHCGVLVALATTRHNPKQRCPRCDELLRAEPAAKAAKTRAAAQPTADAPVPAATEVAATQTAAATPAPASEEPPPTHTEPDSDPPATPAVEAHPQAPETTSADTAEASAQPLAEAPAEPSFEESIAASSLAPANARAATPRRPHARATPSFARARQAAPARPHNWRGPVAIAALLLVLALQLLLAQRAELAMQANWRPVVAAVCSVLRCELPPWHEPAAFTMLDRNVQPKPGMAGVLAVSASFRNDARWPQPWPTLVLSLSDVDGRQVGQRAFAPAEYRGHATADLLAPGQSATVQLDVIEPAPRIVAFTFDFR